MVTLGSFTCNFSKCSPMREGSEVDESIGGAGACKTIGEIGGLIGLEGIALSISLPLRNVVIDLACSGLSTEELAT